MAEEDKFVHRIAGDFVQPEHGLSDARWNEYRKLFREAHLTDGVTKDGVGNLYFITYSSGLAVSGSTKGLVFCAHPVNSDRAFLPCSEQKEAGRDRAKDGKGYEYRLIAGQWYVFADWM